jgi:hypothetical protein
VRIRCPPVNSLQGEGMAVCPYCHIAVVSSRCPYCNARLTPLDALRSWRSFRRLLMRSRSPGREAVPTAQAAQSNGFHRVPGGEVAELKAQLARLEALLARPGPPPPAEPPY